MLLVGLRLELGRPLARVLERQRRGDDDHVAHAPEPLGLQDHPPQPRVDRQPRQPASDAGQPWALLRSSLQGSQLLEQLDAGGHVALVRWLHEREPAELAEPERGHLQDDAGQVGAQDLGVGELRPAVEVLLGVQPDRDARRDPAAAARALVGRRLADRLDRQPLHLGAHGVARDPRDAGVDDVPDAGHGQRGLGDVGGEHDPAPGVGLEDPVLLGGREPGVQRDHLDRADGRRTPPVALVETQRFLQRVRGVPDLPLARQEHQDVAGALGRQLLDRVDDRLGLVADDRLALLILLGELDERPVADVDRVGPPGHLDDRRRLPAAVGEVGGEPLGVDGRRGDDQLQVGPLREQALEVAEQEVDVEAPLVGLVDDDRVVLPQLTVPLELGEQDAVGHQLEPAGLRRPVGEPHLVADQLPQLGAELLRDPLGDRPGRDPARLGVPDQLLLPAPELQADLRQLGGLPGAGLAGDDHDLVVADRLGEVVSALADRQLGGIGDVHNAGHSLPRVGAPGNAFAGAHRFGAGSAVGAARVVGGTVGLGLLVGRGGGRSLAGTAGRPEPAVGPCLPSSPGICDPKRAGLPWSPSSSTAAPIAAPPRPPRTRPARPTAAMPRMPSTRSRRRVFVLAGGGSAGSVGSEVGFARCCLIGHGHDSGCRPVGAL